MEGQQKNEIKISNPHDAMFKECFSNKQIAKDFIIKNLPQEVLKIIDIESMNHSKDSFISQELKETFSDLIYTAKINGRQGVLSFLLEHKSYPDKRAIIQVAKYILEIWMSNISKENKETELTVVVPIVVYHGKQKDWKYKTDIREMIPDYYELPQEVQERLPVFKHELINIMKYQEEDIKKHIPLTRLVLRTLKYIFADEEQFIEILLISLDELANQEAEEAINYILELVLRYSEEVNKELTEKKIQEKIEKLGGKGKMIMTILEQRELKGREEERKRNMEEKISTAKEMLLDNEPVEKIVKYTKLSLEKIEEIREQIKH